MGLCSLALSHDLFGWGQWIAKNQIIGSVGNTGTSTGPHLHYEIRKNNEFRDPLGYFYTHITEEFLAKNATDSTEVDSKNYEFKDDNFDAILLIDTHYFIEEFTNIIPKLLKMLKAKGKIAIFSDEGKGIDGEDDSKTEPQETIIGKYLILNKLKYKCIPLYKENVAHWRKKKQALLELEGEFIKENNQFIYNNRLEECTDHDRNLDGRYLFINITQFLLLDK